MIPNGKPPYREPNKRQESFQDQSLLPTVRLKQLTGSRRRPCHGQWLAKIPIGVGARAFMPRKPIGEQHQCGRINATLGDAEEKAHDIELSKCGYQPASDRAQTP